MQLTAKFIKWSLLAALLVAGGCGDDGSGPSGPGPFNAVRLDLFDASALTAGSFYRLWAVRASSGASTTNGLEWLALAEFV
jgi:hypothetical protein